MASTIQLGSKILEEHEAVKSKIGHTLIGIGNLSNIALLIIGCVGAAGILPGSTMGWLALGLGGGSFALNLAAGKLKKRKITLVLAAISVLLPVILGSLGAAGILSGTQIGWGLITVPLTFFAIAAPLICCGCCCTCCAAGIAAFETSQEGNGV